MQLHMKIDRIGDRMANRGFSIKDIVADRRVDPHEIDQLIAIAEEELDDELEVQTVTLDIAECVQGLRLGFENSPDRRLQDRRRRVEELKRNRKVWKSPYKDKAPSASLVLNEARTEYTAHV